MRKGIGVLAIALIAMFVLVAVEGVILVNFVYRLELSIRAAREAEIIKKINEVEFVKRGLDKTLVYSFYQTSYFIASRGGYFDFNNVPSYNCIPYWRNYTTINYPNFMENIEEVSLKNLNNYTQALADGITVPEYKKVVISKIITPFIGVAIEATASGKLSLWEETVHITDNVSMNKLIKTNILKLFETGRENFIAKDSVGDIVENAITGYDCDDLKEDVISSINSKISDSQASLNNQYSTEKINFDLKADDIRFDPSCNSTVVVRVLIKIRDTENKYPVYDEVEKTTKLRNIQLKFYVLSGNYIIQPITKKCEAKEEKCSDIGGTCMTIVNCYTKTLGQCYKDKLDCSECCCMQS